MSFYTALTGLNAATASLSVTSNNIANVGTTGFKRSRADFGDIFATSPLQKASSVIGQGTALKQVSQEFSQGNIQFSANSLDIAITGDGFFPLKSADGLQDIYTRNGTFYLDDTFSVVNSAGQALMAATVDSSGKADLENLRKLLIPRSTTGDAKETTEIELAINLPADGEVIAADFDPNDPTTYNLNTAVSVFDSGGNEYLATVYYKKTQRASPDDPSNKWQTFVYIGETKLDEFLIQAQDSKGEEYYVNKYGEIKPENEIEPQLIARGVTKLFNIDSLNNKQKSEPSTLSGESLTALEVVNWKIPGQRIADAIADDTRYTTAQISNSQVFAAGTSTLNGGNSVDIDITIGGVAQATLNTATDTPAGIIAAINTAAYGITASLSTDNRINLVGTSGEANNFSISISDNATTATLPITFTDAQAAASSFNPHGLSFRLNVDGSSTPIEVDLSSYNDTTTNGQYTGIEFSRIIENEINKVYGDERYFDLSDLEDATTATQANLFTLRYNDAVDLEIDITRGVNESWEEVTKDDLITKMQDAINAKIAEEIYTNGTITDSAYGITVGYSAVDRTFTFEPTDNSVPLTIRNQNSTSNGVFKIDGTQKTINIVNFDYGEEVIAEGDYIRDKDADYSLSDQRFGVSVNFDETDGTFKIASGLTGDTGSVEILFPLDEEGVAHTDQDTFDAYIETIETTVDGAGVNYRDNPDAFDPTTVPAGAITNAQLEAWDRALAFQNTRDLLGLVAGIKDVEASPTRGIVSTGAIVNGGPIGLNLDNRFSLTSETNKFTITVDNVTGLVELPTDREYTFEGFRSELEKRINALEDAQGRTVNGVTVAQGSAGSVNFLTFSTGTQGDDSFLKVTGPSIWGLTDLESARGLTSEWMVPPQSENINGVPLYVDRDGNETTEAGDFSEAETLDLWSPVYLDKGELTFDTAGNLQSPITPIRFKSTTIGDSGATLQFQIGYEGSTQFSTGFTVYAQSQNGAPEGDLIGLDIGDDGLVSANYSNGAAKNLAKIVLANFSNPTGLRQIGDSSYYETSKSGASTLGEAGTAGYGTLRAGARERANVDLTQELIELITSQRNFQANAKAIETNNTLTQAIINIRN